MDKMHDKKPILKQFYELTKQDFDAYPVWVQCHCIDEGEPWYDDTTEETFRPWDTELPVPPSLAMFLVKSKFTLADGTVYEGFITPQDPDWKGTEPDIGTIQPNIFTHDGKAIDFWFSCYDVNSKIKQYYDSLKEQFYLFTGKEPKDIFPITFQADENLAEGIISGKVYGFYVRKNGQIHIEV